MWSGFRNQKYATKNLFSEKCEAVFGIKNAPLKTYFPKSVKRFSAINSAICHRVSSKKECGYNTIFRARNRVFHQLFRSKTSNAQFDDLSVILRPFPIKMISGGGFRKTSGNALKPIIFLSHHYEVFLAINRMNISIFYIKNNGNPVFSQMHNQFYI